MADEAIVNKGCNILKANGIAKNIVAAIPNEKVTLSMICHGEVTDDDLKRLGANTIGDRLNIKE